MRPVAWRRLWTEESDHLRVREYDGGVALQRLIVMSGKPFPMFGGDKQAAPDSLISSSTPVTVSGASSSASSHATIRRDKGCNQANHGSPVSSRKK
ncbi:MAG: hypothetical protein ACOYXU_08470 [Nitrospirota bacterium]